MDVASADLFQRYDNLLAAGRPSALETAENAAPDLSDAGIADRINESRHELHRIVKDLLGDESNLHDLADRLSDEGDTGMRVLRNRDAAALARQPDLLGSLEVVVRTDGSRPSFLIQDGVPNLASSPAGTWQEHFEGIDDDLLRAISCVGRIDDANAHFAKQGFHGTGFLVSHDLVATNRHVLQAIAEKAEGGSWTVRRDIRIDFGHEFRARPSIDPRVVREVVFAGARPVNPLLPDHSVLDLVLLRLDPGVSPSPTGLAVDIAPDWAQDGTTVCVIGYPGDPGARGNAPALLEKLFQSTFGHKRLAPGEISALPEEVLMSERDWTLSHDCTTLGGNSGSTLLVLGRPQAAAAIHYGGRRAGSDLPAENWAHVFGRALDEPDGHTQLPLRDVLKSNGVQFRDFVDPSA